MTIKFCIICGNEISEKRIEQGKDTCCGKCATKKTCKSQEFRERMKQRMTSPETREKISKSVKAAYQNPKVKENFIKSCKIAQNRPEVKEKISNALKERYKNLEHHKAFIEAMNKEETKRRQSEAQKRRFANPELRRKFINDMNKAKTIENCRLSQLKEETKQKIYDTKKKNNSFNTSIEEELTYKQLQKVFSSNDVIRAHHINGVYDYDCDFYIKSLDLWIECHYSHYHNNEPFDELNEEHLKQLKLLQEKSNNLHKEKDKKNQYDMIIYTWTDLDVRKLKCFKENNLNYKIFYSYKEFTNWLNAINDKKVYYE